MTSIPEELASSEEPLRRSDWFTLLKYHLKIRDWDDYPPFVCSFTSPPEDPAKILVIQLSSIGDVTYTLPALNGLKRRYPAAEIDLLTEAACSTGAVGHPALEKIWKLPVSGWISALEGKNRKKFSGELRRILHDLNEKEFDYVINLHFSPLAASLGKLVEGEKKSGVFMEKNLQPVLKGNPFHGLRFLGLLPGNNKLPLSSVARHSLGLDAFYREVNYYVRKEEKVQKKISELYGQYHRPGSPHLLINTGSRMEKRRWSAEHCRQVVKRLLKNDWEVGLIGGPEDKERLDDISRNFSENERLIQWYKKTESLLEDIHLSDRADLVITTDSGPQHLISMRNNSCLVLGGDMWVGPWNNKSCLLAAKERRLEALPVEAIVCSAQKLLEGKIPEAGKNLEVYSGRPKRDSIWYRLLPAAEKTPSSATFRKWMVGMIKLALWAEEGKNYGWRSVDFPPELLEKLYNLYWEGPVPTPEEKITKADIPATNLISISEAAIEEKIGRFTEQLG